MNNLCDENFIMFAMKAYERPNAIMSEFEEDLKRVKYIKRLIKRYKSTGELKERLILNHIIILGNLFGVSAAVRILFFRVDPEDYGTLMVFLLFLNYMPNTIEGINGKTIHSTDITIDLLAGQRLRNI